MTEIAQPIEPGLSDELRDKEFRQKFFRAESSALIAKQLIGLRKRRGLNQTEVAEAANTKQPAISRAEKADYQNWNIKTLRAIAYALDARIRVVIQPSEDVLPEYDAVEDQPSEHGDCVHSLKGQNIPLPDLPEWLCDPPKET